MYQEDRDDDRACREARDRPDVAPAFAAGPAEPVDEAEQTEGAGHGAGKVQPALVGLRLAKEARGQQRGRDADRGVDQQRDPPAADVQAGEAVEAGEPATEEQADGCAGAGHGGVHRERAVALRSGGERGRDQRQRRGRGQCGTEALQSSSGEQQRFVGRQAAEQRGDAEDDQADHEDPAPSVEVTEAAAEQQQAAEGQRVAGDHPGQVGAGDVEIGLDVGQRDVDDGAVQHHHQLRHGDEHEGPSEVELLRLFAGSDLLACEYVGHESAFLMGGGGTVPLVAAGMMTWSIT